MQVLAEEEVFSAKITHNLTEMALHAGIYYDLWRPEEQRHRNAEDLIRPLECGLERLLNNPEKYKKYNPENGWGNYEVLVKVVRYYIDACKENPQAAIRISR